MEKKGNYYSIPGVLTADPFLIIKRYYEEKGYSIGKMRVKNRRKEIRVPRSIFMYLLYVYCGYSYIKIGKLLLRSHCTVLHNIKKIEYDRLQNYKAITGEAIFFEKWFNDCLDYLKKYNLQKKQDINLKL